MGRLRIGGSLDRRTRALRSFAVIHAGYKVLTSDLLGLNVHGYVPERDDQIIDQLSE